MSRILIAVPRHPWPPRRGDQARALQMATLLAGDHDVVLLAPEAGPRAPAPPGDLPFRLVLYARASWRAAFGGILRALFIGLPLQSGLFHNRALAAALRREARGADLGILQLVRLAAHLGDLGDTPVVVDLIDSLALSTRRRAALDRPWLRPALAAEARRLARWEGRLARRADATLVVSDRDRRAMVEGLPAEVAARVQVVPLAVEVPAPAGSAVADRPPTLALTGNLGYFPTREGLAWFLARVWPALRASRPDLRWIVAGARPGRGVARALSRAGAELIEAPPDLAAVLGRATIALAPMRAGAGQPMKVLEAWAAGVPVVATPWAAAGTTGRPGEDLLVAESPEEWLAALGRLLDHPELGRRLAASAGRRLAADYSRAAVGARLAAVVAAAVEGGEGGRSPRETIGTR